MGGTWYVQVMGEQLGPLNDAQLREMVVKKQLTPDDTIRKGTSAEWMSASRVRGLFDHATVLSDIPIGASISPPLSNATATFSGEELDSVLGINTPSHLSNSIATTDFRGTEYAPASVEQSHQFRPSLISCPDCGKRISPNANSCPNCGHSFFRPSRVVAIALAMILGSFGAHKFYLRKPGQAIIYLLFCWLYVPGIVGLVEGFQYLFMDDDSFARKFG